MKLTRMQLRRLIQEALEVDNEKINKLKDLIDSEGGAMGGEDAIKSLNQDLPEEEKLSDEQAKAIMRKNGIKYHKQGDVYTDEEEE